MGKGEEEKKDYGYARISSNKQELRRQIAEIQRICPKALIIKERFTGATMQRPGWSKLMARAKAGCVKRIYMDELSRMGRNRQDGFKQWMELYELGVEVYFIKTPHVNTQTYKDNIGKMLDIKADTKDDATNELISSITKGLNRYMCELAKRQIYIAFDEAATEREYLSKRTSEGMKVAAMNGAQIGRKKGTKIETKKAVKAKKKIRKHYKGFGGELSATECMRICQISKMSFYSYLKDLKNEEGSADVLEN